MRTEVWGKQIELPLESDMELPQREVEVEAQIQALIKKAQEELCRK